MSNNSERQYFFYYLREKIESNPSKSGHPFACVCISPNQDGTINRGISICSKADFFNKKKARGMAYGRCNSSPFSDFNKILTEKLFRNCGTYFKSLITNGAPTQYEQRILFKPEFN